MELNTLIKELQCVQEKFGNIKVAIQDAPKDHEKLITGYESFFIVPEKYDEGWICNIRWWPY